METMSLSLILTGISVLCPRTGGLSEHKLDVPLLLGPFVALEGSTEEFYCEIPGKPATLPVLYELYVESNPHKVIGAHSSLSGEIATFPLVIKTQHDGRLICKASGHNDTDIGSSISYGLDLKVIVPVGGLRILSHPSSQNVWEGQTLTLRCKTMEGTYVSYDWFFNNAPVRMPYDRNSDTLIIHTLSVQHTGEYKCVASNQFNDTMIFSSVNVTTVNVKEYLTKPEISVNVEKHPNGGYKAVVTCRSDKGTPLNTFSLLNDSQLIAMETADKTFAHFNVPIELNREMGRVRCNASNEGNWVMSEPISLTVESVGGAVRMTSFTHVGVDFQVVGVVLRCEVERGRFPLYRWFLNDSRLTGRGGFYAVAWSDKAVLSLSVGRDSAGFYRCEASDRFDNSSSISSAKMLINKEELNRVPPEVAIVVFSCFILLNISVLTCCIYGVVLRRRFAGKSHLIEQRRNTEATVQQEDEDEEDEDYLMLAGYDEDAVVADRMSESAEDEDGSVDETLQYESPASK